MHTCKKTLVIFYIQNYMQFIIIIITISIIIAVINNKI